MMEKQEQIKTLPWFGVPKIWPYVKKYKKKPMHYYSYIINTKVKFNKVLTKINFQKEK